MDAPGAAAAPVTGAPVTAAASAQTTMATPRPAPPMRDRSYLQSLGVSLNTNVKQARVLMVGAGGIGCELLKNLVLSGFGEVHVVDLDTIDLSNLNRQFLFRHEHIKKSKALVAKEAAHKFNPNVKITAHHANIKDLQFNVEWFRSFTLVFNALDNLDARRHVNKMCLAADVPLIESGTTGFNGQVQVIKKGVTACYDCSPKETPKTFPVCTIRSTPSQPIHCIVWGKSYLLNEIFGASEDESAFDHSEDADNAAEIEELKRESAALRKIREAVGTEDFPQMLFDKVFKTDVERLRSMEDMWKTRRKPDPLDYETLNGQAATALASKVAILRNGQKAWSLEENLTVFIDSLSRLSKRMLELKKAAAGSDSEPLITFDKDDDDTLDFVTASANIRSHVFAIDKKSRFDIKQMAGNIIPAIATTNAIVAGLCVLQSFKVLRGDFTQAKEVFLSPFAEARLLASDKSREPKPDCPVCGVFQSSVYVDFERATLNDLVETFLRMELGYGEKDLVVSNDVGILYDADEDENLDKKLSELGIGPGSFLTVIDEDDDEPFINVVLDVQSAKDPLEQPVKGLQLDQKLDIPHKKVVKPSSLVVGMPNGASQTNGKHALETDAEPKNLKRPRGEDADGPLEAKKAKTAAPPADIVVIDDDGAILIDD